MAVPVPGRAGLAVSLGLHLLLLAWLMLIGPPPPLPERGEEVVLVELVARQDVAAVPDARPEPGPVPQDEAPGILGNAPGMRTATRLMAGAVFADPRNTAARAMLGMIVPALMREQVCGVEAMEQIKLAASELLPECVISYAFAATETEGEAVTARGAAVLIGADWYRLEYECVLGADPASVASFRYRVGEIISDADVERLELASCK